MNKRPFEFSIFKRAYLGIAACAALLLAVGGVTIWSHLKSTDAFKWVRHTQEVKLAISRLFSVMQDVETGARGFVLTGQDQFLEPYESAITHIRDDLRELRKATADNPRQQDRLDALEVLVNTRLTTARELIDTRRNMGLEAAMECVQTGAGKRAMDDIRLAIHEIDSEESRLQDYHDQSAKSRAMTTTVSMCMAVVLILANAIGAFVRMNRDFNSLRRAHDELEHRVEQRTADLATANRTLQAEVEERARNVAELRERESRFRAVFETATDAILTIDERGNIESANAAALQMFGYSSDQIIGHNVKKLMPEPFRSEHDQYLANYRSTGRRRIIGIGREVSGRRYDDSVFPIELAIGEANLGDRRIFTGIIRDVTKRKSDEEALRTAHDELERRVEERTEELERSNRDLEQFAYVASHDLQEPLRMVASYMQLLERRYKDRLDADAAEFIQFAVDGTVRMKLLIGDLLAYSRVGSKGKAPEPTDCETVFEHAVANLAAAIAESNARVTHDPLPTVMADESQLVQLLQNLIGNAVKYRATDRTPEIHVSAQRRNDEWLFAVRDNGIGIESQYADRIFVIFQRLHARNEYSGTGIGLAVCKRIVERHDGKIWMESEPENGATFYFTIPQDREISNEESEGAYQPHRDLVGGGFAR